MKKSKWLLNNQDEFVSPQEVSIYTLSTIYDVSSDAAKELIRFLEISTEAEDGELDDDNSNLSEEQRKKLAFAEQLENLGFGIADVKAFLEYKKRQEWLSEEPENNNTNSFSSSQKGKSDKRDPDLDDEDLPQNTKTVVRDIIKRTKTQRNELASVEAPDDSPFDEDEYTPVPVDYSKSIERAKQKSAREIERIANLEDLQNQAVSAERYSFRWFKVLLEMECKNYGEVSSSSKEVSISFGKVEKESGTKRTLILRNPSRYIPQFMEDLADIPLVLHFGDKTKTLAIEVANIQSYTLRVKLKSHAEIEGIDLSTVTSASIDAQSPSFLLEELKEKFLALEFDDDYNLRDNLCENIEFVFGPPGTGKTTHIAKNILMPMMQGYKPCRVLVLTPTNKAADVIVHRIMELSGANRAYENWLVRFGATGDEFIEESPVFRDKTFDITSKSKSVTVTTIARFPYDFFMPPGKRLFLDGINWDYIIIDEASMISLAYIIYPLFKKTPTKFIIAGDPFQIEPITSIDLWKNENIYTMVKLNSFVNPSTVPYNYKVELLTTQYRSIPVVGEVFSKLTYGGVLKHYRTSDSLRVLNTGSDFSMKALNIIKFPVSKYESIYKPKRLQSKSNYQVYSALFTYEFACYLSKILTENNQGKISIGIIAPYRAQADLIDKLLSSEKLPDEVEVQTGTIHGFQGDECDIILTVFNPPPSISATKEMFLNKKNIINVSISRAKDYLFVIMPDNDTDNVQNLRLLKQVERLIKSSADWREYNSPDLERIMFGNDKYLEENAFSTGHQSVNVYGLPEMRYEIRTEDAAVDVQIHKNVRPKENMPAEISQQKPNSGTQLSIRVRGRFSGEYSLVCYEGKLRKATDKATSNYFIPIEAGSKYKLIPVAIAKESREIFIAENSYQKYIEAIMQMDEVEIRKTYMS